MGYWQRFRATPDEGVTDLVTTQAKRNPRVRGGTRLLASIRGRHVISAAPDAPPEPPPPQGDRPLVDAWGIPILENQPQPPPPAPGIDFRPSPAGMDADAVRWWTAYYARRGEIWP